jgi:NADPH2:quinone reductase
MCEDLFRVIAQGAVQAPVRTRMALAEVAEAHRRLESRQTTGSIVLIP